MWTMTVGFPNRTIILPINDEEEVVKYTEIFTQQGTPKITWTPR